MPYTQEISKELLERIRALGLPEVVERNPWLVLHVKGDGKRAAESWNAKAYRNSAGDLKLVTTDWDVLMGLVYPGASSTQKPTERVISIDDSGWGYPLLGVLFGVHDSRTGKIMTTEVGVEFFQPPRFGTKEYLEQAAIQVMLLLDEEFPDCDSDDTVIKVCTGYVNNGIALRLRAPWYKSRLRREAIGEPLQSALEREHREYVRRLVGEDIYYDPKDLGPSGIGRAYNDVMSWIQRNNAWHLAKTGWGSMAKCRKGPA